MSYSENMDHAPRALTNKEWQEILAVQEVRETWGLDGDVTPEEFASRVYAAKFHFTSGGPGYVGDLYILQGDALTDAVPVVLKRSKAGTLETVA
jgi:hypothetical protein